VAALPPVMHRLATVETGIMGQPQMQLAPLARLETLDTVLGATSGTIFDRLHSHEQTYNGLGLS
jgi:hypothetical protein